MSNPFSITKKVGGEELETRDILDSEENVIGTLSLPVDTSEVDWNIKLSEYTPVEVILTQEQQITKAIKDAEMFGNELIKQFTVENVAMGITQAGKTEVVTNYLHRLMHYMMTGSLYAALNEIAVILADSDKTDVEPFVSNERIQKYETKIKIYLGIPVD